MEVLCLLILLSLISLHSVVPDSQSFHHFVIVSMCKMKQMNVILDFVNNTILIHSVTGTAAAGPLAGVHQGAPNAHGCWNVSA